MHTVRDDYSVVSTGTFKGSAAQKTGLNGQSVKTIRTKWRSAKGMALRLRLVTTPNDYDTSQGQGYQSQEETRSRPCCGPPSNRA